MFTMAPTDAAVAAAAVDCLGVFATKRNSLRRSARLPAPHEPLQLLFVAAFALLFVMLMSLLLFIAASATSSIDHLGSPSEHFLKRAAPPADQGLLLPFLPYTF
jgi:hypothetical protein